MERSQNLIIADTDLILPLRRIALSTPRYMDSGVSAEAYIPVLTRLAANLPPLLRSYFLASLVAALVAALVANLATN